MKKIIHIALGIFILSLAANAQSSNETIVVSNSPVTLASPLPTSFTPIDKISYQVKSHNQKTGAWVLMGAGFVGMVTGIIVESSHAEDNAYGVFVGKTNNTGIIIAIAGGCLMVGSIPLFVASARNKAKAKLSVSTQNTNLGIPRGINKNVTGITMSIPIGR